MELVWFGSHGIALQVNIVLSKDILIRIHTNK